MNTVLEIDSLKKYYGKPGNQTKALNGITFQVMEGEFLGIMGSSGSGKSTLLNCIATVIQPSSGRIVMRGTQIQSLKGKNPMSLHNVPDKESRDRLTRLASYLEITDVLDKFPSQMSGGQKQRVAAARALIMDPGIILADEPTGALDSKNAKTLMKKLAGLNEEENATILMVTHDSNAASYCKRILFIQDGQIFHELRRDTPDETRQEFYERILKVMSQLGGGSANVL